MTYEKRDGTTFVLAHHSPEEWADVIRDRLRRLGCSDRYARSVASSIEHAVEAGATS